MRRRRSRVLTALLGALAVPALAVAATTSSPPSHARAVVFPAGDDGVAEVTGSGTRSAAATGSGALVGSGTASATASAHAARAAVSTGPVSAFDGLVSVSGLTVRASARNGSSSVSGTVRGLVVDGRAIGSPSAPATYPMRFGRVSVLGSAALTVTLTEDYHGFSAGASVSVGAVSAGAPAASRPAAPRVETNPAAPAPEPRPRRTAPRRPARATGHPRARPRPKRVPRRRAPKKVRSTLTGGGYAFPVASAQATAADTFGAARQIGAHQGDDIFGPFGAPVVAAHAGRIGRVGTLPISGNRLWLYTPRGDAFFYAHLSAFSPAAVDGRRVRAGDVLGFVGNTGDAEPTPPHLHFEVHPGGEPKPAVDPFALLRAWRRGADVDRGAWTSDTAERPGTLVQIRDFLAGR